MSHDANKFRAIINKLKTAYGTPKPPPITDPFEMILYENIAYLVDDDRRDMAFDKLKKSIGTHPADILSASPAQLNELTKFGGINPLGQIAKIVKAAQIAMMIFNGNLSEAITRPVNQARTALKKFPGIGEPGAGKILLFNKKLPVLALESNGLRVITRVGYGEESRNYSATYRSVQQAIAPELPKIYNWLVNAHLLLRRHGKEICKRTKPMCVKCPLATECKVGRAHAKHAK